MGCLFRKGGCQWVAGVGLLGFLTCGSGSARLANGLAFQGSTLHSQEIQREENEPTHPLSPKQKEDLLKARFEKMKRDADELTSLAKSLQDDLNKSNENILSLSIVEKAEQIEKLAKSVREKMKGNP